MSKYVIRNQEGVIAGWCAYPAADTEHDPIDEQSAEWLAYITPSPPTKAQRIAALQFAYDEDKKRLDSAWLSAIIADGVEETARKGVIAGQMADLAAQLEADILAIIME